MRSLAPPVYRTGAGLNRLYWRRCLGVGPLERSTHHALIGRPKNFNYDGYSSVHKNNNKMKRNSIKFIDISQEINF